MTLEMGKTLTDANAEVTYASDFFRWFAEEACGSAASFACPVRWQSILTYASPIGVALLVTPWTSRPPWPPADRPALAPVARVVSRR